jgi:hypothetical protein
MQESSTTKVADGGGFAAAVQEMIHMARRASPY